MKPPTSQQMHTELRVNLIAQQRVKPSIDRVIHYMPAL
jgi:hypothetical protein